MVTQFDVESNSWTYNPAFQVRDTWRKAVEEVATRARAVLPEPVHGRIEKAIQIVLNGDVELLPDDKAKVGSQSNGVTKYFIVDGTCDCRDFEKAVDHWCKHRLAYGIYKRSRALAKEQLQALDSPASKAAEPVEPVVEVPVESVIPVTPTPEPVMQAALVVPQSLLPEAPASANVYITIAGRKVQLTLRDHDEENLLSRMEKLLERFPSDEAPEPEASTTPPENWCQIHQVYMRQYSNAKGSWFSHRLDNKNWCNGKGRGK